MGKAKRVWIGLLTLLCTICCAFGLVACGGGGGSGNSGSESSESSESESEVGSSESSESSESESEVGSSESSESSEKHNHAYVTQVTAPTCTAWGYTTYTCECGDSYVGDYVEALGHDLEPHDAKAPTCTEIGWDEYNTCSRCDYTTYVELSVLGHTTSEWIIDVEPTCTVAGSKHKECTVCQVTLETEEIPATGHAYVTQVTAPTCTAWGYTTYTCECGDSYVGDYVEALGHSYNDGRVILAPTCEETGIKLYTCTTCSAAKSEEIPATGHTYAEEWSFDETHHWHAATCEHTDEISNKAEHDLQDGIYCSVCDFIQVTPAAYFTFTLKKDDTYEIKAKDKNNLPAKILLPSVYEGKAVTSIGDDAFYNCDSLTSITIPDSVTSIGRSAFSSCSSLTSIEIPDSVTSIGDWAFDWCRRLTSIEIPDSVTSIGYRVFAWCRSLTSIVIPDSVTSIGWDAFSCCSSLTSITIDENNASYKSIDGNLYTKDGTTLIQYAIGKTATSFVIPDSVTSIVSYAFENCSSLTSIEIPDSVTSIGDWAFRNCSSLTSITVDENNASYKSIDGNLYTKDGTTLIQYAIGKTATSFVIPDSVTSIGEDAFLYCSSLTSVTIPDSVTSIGKSAFASCSSLTSVTIGNGVTSIGNNAFYNTAYYNDTNHWESGVLYIGKHLIEAKDSISGAYTIKEGTLTIADYAFANCSSLTSVTIPDSVTSIGDWAFYDCDSLTSIEIPDSVTSIGDRAFAGCSSLTSITLGNNVTSIGERAFYECGSLTSVTIGNNVTSIGNYAFYECGSLTSVVIPDSVTSIGEYAFNGCYKLIEVKNLSSLNITAGSRDYGYVGYYAKRVYSEGESYLSTDENGYILYDDGTDKILVGYTGTETDLTLPSGITQINQYAFSNCDSLTSIVIPDSVTSIGGGAFYNCSSLTSIVIGNSVTSIGYEAFASCSSLTSIVIPDSVTSIGYAAFRNCSSLTSIVIPDSVTSIGDYVFRGCSSLTSIVIPDSVTSIGGWAFYECYSLTSIEIPDSVTSIGEGAFYDCDSLTSVTFENPNGWWRSDDSMATSGTSIPSDDLSNPATAATYLRSTYCVYYWKRSE